MIMSLLKGLCPSILLDSSSCHAPLHMVSPTHLLIGWVQQNTTSELVCSVMWPSAGIPHAMWSSLVRSDI